MAEEATRVVSLIYTFPIFVLILSSIFLQESLSYQKYLGVMLLVASAFLVSYKKENKKFLLSTAVALLIFYSFGSASLKVLTKYALYNMDYWSFFFWSLVGNMLGAFTLTLIPKIRKKLVKDVSEIDRKTWIYLLAIDIFVWLGYLFLFIATSIGYVSLIAALMSIQPLLVFIFTLILTIHKPEILKEEISKASLLFKSLAVIFIIIGSYLIVI
jgi:uncharacterized membrane protein